MTLKFDLLGDPIPENQGMRGANGHIATAKNINKVRQLLVSGKDKKRISEELGISVPTLSKHYFRSGAKSVQDARRIALADAKARNLLRLDLAAEKGNVTAIKALNDIYDAEILKDHAREVAGYGATEPKAKTQKPTPRGKKEQQIHAAEQIISGDDLLNPKSFH